MMTNRSRVVLYTGVTNAQARHVWQHQNGTVEGFTKKYHLTLLVYHETYHDIRDALARETEIKGWRRSKKIALVETLSPKWNDLSRTLFEQCEVPRRPAAARDDKSRSATFPS